MPPRGNDDFSAPSGFGSPSSFAGPSTFRTLAEEDPADLTEGGWTKPAKPNRADVQGISSAQNEASIAAREALIAQYGTSDKDKVAQLMSLGVFEKDAGTRYKLDPEGFKMNVGEALKILGRDGINVTPDGEAARKYRVGVGQGGEPYYTNLSNRELHDEQQARLGTEAHAGESQHSVYDLKNLHRRDLPEGGGAAAEEKRTGMSNAEQMFEGNLDRATDRAMKDERDMEHTSKLAEYSDELIQYGREKGGNKARERIQKELMDGTFLKKNFTGKEAILLNRMLEKRIRSTKEIHSKRLDPNFFIPDVVRDPTASDPTQPASIANPGGGVTPQAVTTYEHESAVNSADQVLSIAGNKDQELPRTAQYATGKQAPKSQRATSIQTAPNYPTESIQTAPFEDREYALYPKETKKKAKESRIEKLIPELRAVSGPAGNEGDLGGEDSGARAGQDFIEMLLAGGRKIKKGVRRLADGPEFQ